MRPVGNGFVRVLCIILAGPAMAATIPVTTNDDLPLTDIDPSTCSLREAIQAVISTNPQDGCPAGSPEGPPGNGRDTITFDIPLPNTITLSAALPTIDDIDDGVTISGPGARSLTISGANQFQVFRISPAQAVTIEGLTIANGRPPKNGGAIQNFGQLTVKNTSFVGNTAVEDGGAISNEKPGQLTVLNSTFSGNFIDDATPQEEEGGAIVNIDGTATIANSTFFGNRAPNTGGAILNAGNNDGTGNLMLINSTINGNIGSEAGGGVFTERGGTITLRNTLLAANPGNNCGSESDGVIIDGGGNLEDGNGALCNFGIDSMPSGNAALDPAGPQPNGGPTDTIALTAGSDAIDLGLNDVCAAAPVSNLDQRGFPRPVGSSCDVGAFERDAVSPQSNLPPVVTDPGNQTGVVGAIVNLPISASDPREHPELQRHRLAGGVSDQRRNGGRHWHAEHGGHLERDRDGG